MEHQSKDEAAFEFDGMEGLILRGVPDSIILTEALTRFKHARNTVEPPPDILEFPFSTSGLLTSKGQTVHIRWHALDATYEIKIFVPGLYQTQQLTGHFILKGKAPKPQYEMTIS